MGDIQPELAEMARRAGLELRVDDCGLALSDGDVVVRGDFAHMVSRVSPRNLNRELVVRAAKVKDADAARTAFDATAGLGEDSLLLAAAGFTVQLHERNPIIAALLRDALKRAAALPDLAEAVGRMHLHVGDSVEALASLEEAPDVVLLDPMFPESRKSASVKKKLHMLQQLETPCDDEVALLEAALRARPRKVVIKRPVKGPYLAGRKPDYSIAGKVIRYDCFSIAR